ncbi:MAG: spore maturation protein A [Oscillospiraceae bacterium]|nr:spore maturation protein A [Oscillospiraceae bacterium]
MLMGGIWAAMLLVSLVAALLGGKTGALLPAAMEGAAAAVELCVKLTGSLCLFGALGKAMEQSGLMKKLGRLLRPIFRRLFPRTAADEEALGYLSANVAANVLGLGNAATPMGIAAAQRMKAISGSSTASDEMCRLIVMNTASIQLLPTTVASLRASLGAKTPFDILPAVWISSVLSLSAGLLAAKLFARRKYGL